MMSGYALVTSIALLSFEIFFLITGLFFSHKEKKNEDLEDSEREGLNWVDVFESESVFFLISVLLPLFLVLTEIPNSGKVIMVLTKLGPILLMALGSIVGNFIYNFSSKREKKSGRNIYQLKEEEKKVTVVIEFLLYAIFFFKENSYDYAFVYVTYVIGDFLGIFPTWQVIKEKCKKLTIIPTLFWFASMVISVVFILSFCFNKRSFNVACLVLLIAYTGWLVINEVKRDKKLAHKDKL